MTLVNAETGEVVAHSLAECESVIERGLTTFIEVGQALMEIRDGRLRPVMEGTSLTVAEAARILLGDAA